MIKPQYICLECNYEFERELPGPTQCPRCGHLYVKWLNYEQMRPLFEEDYRRYIKNYPMKKQKENKDERENKNTL